MTLGAISPRDHATSCDHSGCKYCTLCLPQTQDDNFHITVTCHLYKCKVRAFASVLFLSSSSSCAWRVRRVSCSLILKMKLVPPSLPRSSYVPSSFWLYCSACFGSLVVSILCTCCSNFFWYCFISFTMFCAPVFCLLNWFFSLSSFVIPSRCLKNFICAASKRCSSLFFSTQASLSNFNAALAVTLL